MEVKRTKRRRVYRTLCFKASSEILRGTELVIACIFTQRIFGKQITICTENTGGSKTHTHRLFLDSRRRQSTRNRRSEMKAFVREGKVDTERMTTWAVHCWQEWNLTISSVSILFIPWQEIQVALNMDQVRTVGSGLATDSLDASCIFFSHDAVVENSNVARAVWRWASMLYLCLDWVWRCDLGVVSQMVVVAFSSPERILGECSTIFSPACPPPSPLPFFFIFYFL